MLCMHRKVCIDLVQNASSVNLLQNMANFHNQLRHIPWGIFDCALSLANYMFSMNTEVKVPTNR